MDRNDLIGIENQIDYKFKNRDLLRQAFVRSSYAAENGGADNEILEFIGDKVLDMIVVQLLTEEYGYMAADCDDFEQGEWNEFYSECDEGELTDIKKSLVQRKNLAERIDMLGFADFLIMGKSDIKNHVEEKASVKEDLFEAIIGAVALDCGWDMTVLRPVVEQLLEPDLSEEDENYIQLVQEWSLRKYGVLPLYHVEKYNPCDWYSVKYLYNQPYRSSPQNLYMQSSGGRNPRFQAYLKIGDFEFRIPGFVDKRKVILGFGDTQKEAREDAARLAYECLKSNNLLFTIRDEIDNPNMQDAISQLEILARRGYFEIPRYSFKERHDRDGNPVWHCRCVIGDIDETAVAESSVKKNAKKNAAYKMLMKVLQQPGL